MSKAAASFCLLVLLVPAARGAVPEKNRVQATLAASSAPAEQHADSLAASPGAAEDLDLVLHARALEDATRLHAVDEDRPGPAAALPLLLATAPAESYGGPAPSVPAAAEPFSEEVIEDGPFARARLFIESPVVPGLLPLADEGPFAGGRLFFEANAGAYFSQRGLGPATPTFDFAPINLRLGMVLNDPCLPGCLRGSFQAMAEFSTAPVVSGFGNIVVGPTALLRYNWIQPNCRLVPYLQGGAGFAYNDAYEDRNQRAIGQAVEFTLKAAAGCHYFINDHVSVDAEGGLTHISNANLATRNYGINALCGMIGVSFYFPCGRR